MRQSIRPIALLTIVTLVLSGCVVGQSLDMSYEAQSDSPVGQGVSVRASVTDDRPFVTSGGKAPHYIGQYRAGFGIPYDVSTDGDVPLEDLIERDINKDLSSLGFGLAPAGMGTQLKISIEDWNFDAYQNGRFVYAFSLQILDANGATVATSNVNDEVTVKGTFWTGGKGGFEKAMPQLYRDAITALVRENDEFLNALSEQQQR